jgi:GH24 family phage-related lysozyme (muramidase)
MDIEKLRETLKVDEGVKNEIYLDHLSLPTCGIGHLITEDDPEHGLEVGTHIDDERVNELFDQDVQVTLDECRLLFQNFDDLPEEVKQICANLMFNMGRPRLSRFHKFRKALENSDWIEAGKELKNSRYYRQVTARADRLIARLEAIT